MERTSEFIFDIGNISRVLNYFEENYRSFNSIENLKFQFYESLGQKELLPHHQLIYGVMMLESFDINLNDLGNNMIKEFFTNVASNQIHDFFQFINLLDPSFKYYIISVISLTPELININRSTYNRFVRHMKFFLNAVDIPENKICLESEVSFLITETHQTSTLVKTIISMQELSEITIDYSQALNTNIKVISPIMIAEACVYLSRMERHPLVQTFNFLSAVHKLDLKFIDNFVDCLFEMRDLIDFDKLNTIFSSYYKAYKIKIPLINLIKYRNYPNFCILLAETVVYLAEFVSFNGFVHNLVNISVIYAENIIENNSPWSSLQFIGLILIIYNSVPERALKLIRTGILNEPDYLLLGIIQQPRISISGYIRKILHEILIYYIKTERSSILILKYVWSESSVKDSIRPLIIQSLQEYFSQNFSDSLFRLNRILDITQTLDATNQLLQTTSLAFGIEFAFSASRRGVVNLSYWLQIKFFSLKDQFIAALFSYLIKHYSGLLYGDNQHLINESPRIQQNTSTLDDTLIFLFNNRNHLNKEQSERINTMYINYYVISNYTPKRSPDPCVDKYEDTAKVIEILFSTINNCNSEEEKFNVIDKFLKENVVKYSRQTHSFTLYYIGKVLTEPQLYRYIEDLELHYVACLFSKMLSYGFVNAENLIEFADSMFNEYPTNSRYFFCAVTIVAFCYEFMEKSPSICSRWVSSTFYASLPPFIRFCAEYTHNIGNIPFTESGDLPFVDPAVSRSKLSNYIADSSKDFNPLNLKSLLVSEIRNFGQHSNRKSLDLSLPSPNRPEKYKTMMNSLNEEYIEKFGTFDLDPSYFNWFSLHLVTKVIPNHVDNFNSYLQFLRKINNKKLYDSVRETTDMYIKKLLFEYKFPNDQKERRLLNHLSLWFGYLTIFDNKIPLYHEINYKHLLVEVSFRNQQDIMLIITFVKNYLHFLKNKHSAARYNPFVYEIFRVLKEIYLRFDARVEVKFEIEVMFRMLEINIKSIEASKYQKIPEILYKMNTYLPWTDMQKKIKTFSLNLSSVEVLPYEKVYNCVKNGLSQNLNLEFCHKELRENVAKVIEEIVNHVSNLLLDKCSESISSLVYGVVIEDFKKDPNDSRLKFCARTLGKSLCLAQANVMLKSIHFIELCKLLKERITNVFLSKVEIFIDPRDKEHIETMVFELCQNNIDYIVAASLVTCTERILFFIEAKLKKELESRRDFATNKNDFTKRLSIIGGEKIMERHKVKQYPPTQTQTSIYNDFNKLIPGFIMGDKHLLEKETNMNDKINISYFLKFDENHKETLFSICKYFYAKIFSFYNTMQYEIIAHLSNVLKTLNYTIHSSASTWLPVCIHQAVILLFSGGKYDFSDVKIQRLNDDIIDFFLQLRSCKFLGNIVETIISNTFIDINYLTRYKYTHIVVLLCSKNLILHKKIDSQFTKDCYVSKLVEFPEFCSNFFSQLFTDAKYRGVSNPCQFPRSISILNDIAQNQLKFTEISNSEPDKIEEYKISSDSVTQNIELISSSLFEEWIRVYYSENYGCGVITTFKLFMLKLAKAGFLASEKKLVDFIRNILKVALFQSDSSNDITVSLCHTFLMIDSLLQLIVFLVKFKSDKVGNLHNQKLKFFMEILQVIRGYISAPTKDKYTKFYSHVFEKIILGLITEISRPDIVSHGLNERLLCCLSGFIHTLSPEVMPKFLDSFLNIVSDSNLWFYSLRSGYKEKQGLLFSILLCDILQYLKNNYNENQNNYKLNLERALKIFRDLNQVYPQFIAHYYILFINNLHFKFNNIRNVILCACPSNSKAIFGVCTDYESPKVFSLPHVNIPASLLNMTETYVKNKIPGDFLTLCISYFQNLLKYLNAIYDSGFVNEYTYYLCCIGCEEISSKKLSITQDSVKLTLAYRIIYHIAESVPNHSLYALLISLISHIRYNTNHSAFFIYLIQSLFISTQKEYLKEKIIRVIFERIVASGPLPIGLLYITSKFLTDPIYHLKTYKFMKEETVSSMTEKVRRNLAQFIKTK